MKHFTHLHSKPLKSDVQYCTLQHISVEAPGPETASGDWAGQSGLEHQRAQDKAERQPSHSLIHSLLQAANQCLLRAFPGHAGCWAEYTLNKTKAVPPSHWHAFMVGGHGSGPGPVPTFCTHEGTDGHLLCQGARPEVWIGAFYTFFSWNKYHFLPC